MTNDQAVKIIECLGWGYTDGEIKEAVHMATDALRSQTEAEGYRTPKKVIYDSAFTVICPTCGNMHSLIGPWPSYCMYCGQAIEWPKGE